MVWTEGNTKNCILPREIREEIAVVLTFLHHISPVVVDTWYTQGRKTRKMCGPTQGEKQLRTDKLMKSVAEHGSGKTSSEPKAPIGVVLVPPTLAARYACASVMLAVFGVWGHLCFTPESQHPPVGSNIHSWTIPTMLTISYLLVLPLMRIFSTTFLSESVDVKLLLKETMVVYNGGQVLLNLWMVYKIVEGLISKGLPFIGDVYTLTPGVSHALWIHYVDKYLEFFDTFFMVLRGRMDQASRVE